MVNNPFKVGDKVVRCSGLNNFVWLDAKLSAGVHEVVKTGTYATGESCVYIKGHAYALDAKNFRIAIAGVDYPATKRDDNTPLQPSGHLPDGSSVQQHSAGGLYPVVIWHRDKKLPGAGKYDVGLTWPDQAEPVWFRDYVSAVNVAEDIKESLK